MMNDLGKVNLLAVDVSRNRQLSSLVYIKGVLEKIDKAEKELAGVSGEFLEMLGMSMNYEVVLNENDLSRNELIFYLKESPSDSFLVNHDGDIVTVKSVSEIQEIKVMKQSFFNSRMMTMVALVKKLKHLYSCLL